MDKWIIGPRISRDNNYNILRIIGAVAVMYGHMYVLLGYGAPSLYANEVNAIGFKMLMVLSGYMITQSCIYEKRASYYAVKRVFRLMPALIVYTVLMTFVLGPLLAKISVKDYFSNTITWEYLYNIVLNPRFQLPALFANNPYPYAVNGSLWALPIEVSLYILIYFVLKIFSKNKYRRCLICAFSVAVIVMQGIHLKCFPSATLVFWGTDWIRIFNIYPYFFMGALYSLTDIKRYCNLQVAFVLFFVSMLFSTNHYVIYELVAILLIPYIMISIGECTTPIFANLLNGLDISYGLYLWGFPVQQILIQYLVVEQGYNIGANSMFCLALAVTVILSLFSWFFVEKPTMTLLKKMLK